MVAGYKHFSPKAAGRCYRHSGNSAVSFNQPTIVAAHDATHLNAARAVRVMKYGVETPNAQGLIAKVSRYLPAESVQLVEQAYAYAHRCHAGQNRKSGEPYIAHPLAAAAFLADLNLDSHTICGALLHDVIEDCGVTVADLRGQFGPEVAKLVDGVTKLTRMDYGRLPGVDLNGVHPPEDPDKLYAESLRKMLVSMAEDIRVAD